MTAQDKKLVIAGGGTGGHIFPAIAIADAWESDGGDVLFVGTHHGLENRILPQRGKPLALLKVGQIKGKGLAARLRTLLGLPVAIFSAVTILRRYRPHVVLGMGGYVSAPTVVAARLLGIPTALHEQNARAGLTNRLLGKITDRVFVSFAETVLTFSAQDGPAALERKPSARKSGTSASKSRTLAPKSGTSARKSGTSARKSGTSPHQNKTPAPTSGTSPRHKRNRQRVRHTGNPVRAALHAEGQKEEILSGDRPFRLLVFGGSQGAQVFNGILPPTIQTIKKRGMPVQIRHQVPASDLRQVRAHYERLGIEATTASFFQNMAEAYREADLVICRSGATSVAELAALGKPSLLIPYPFAADDHQTANASAMVDVGGGWMRSQGALSQAWLTEFLLARMADPEGLVTTGRKALTLANPQAATLILENLLTLATRQR